MRTTYSFSLVLLLIKKFRAKTIKIAGNVQWNNKQCQAVRMHFHSNNIIFHLHSVAMEMNNFPSEENFLVENMVAYVPFNKNRVNVPVYEANVIRDTE